MIRRPAETFSQTAATRAGFALAEVLVGLLLLAIALLGAGTALLHGLKASREVRLQLRAAELAADLGEEMAMAQSPGAAGILVPAWAARARAALPAGASVQAIRRQAAGQGAPSLWLVVAHLSWGGPAAGDSLEIPLPDWPWGHAP